MAKVEESTVDVSEYIYTIEDAARLSGMSVETLRLYAWSGRVDAVKVAQRFYLKEIPTRLRAATR